ncbi:TPA: hypothetical protein RMI67_005892 [Bacillus cereus]|nr:hypothetical protein [Bacillus cereus]
MVLETVFASSLLFATNETIHFTKGWEAYHSYTTMQEQSIVPESHVLQIKTGCSKTNVLLKKWISRDPSLNHITAKGVQVEACYTGETIRC